MAKTRKPSASTDAAPPAGAKGGRSGKRPESHLKRGLKRLLWLLLGMLFCLACFLLGGYVWFIHRPQPPNVHETLFEGVTYTRETRRSPRPLVIHVVTVDLDAPGIGFLVTPGDPKDKYPLKARTTSQFLKEFGCQIAVNGDYFFPFRSHLIFDYYPHVGDPVDVEGFAASRGRAYALSAKQRSFPTLYLSRDNQASFERPIGELYNAISANSWLVRRGKNAVEQPDKSELYPCTAVALDKTARKLLIIVVDGRQPNYSEGVYLREFAEIIRQHGGYNAIDLDGGGSETLVAEGKNGTPVFLNDPIDCYLPGRERAVANHLGIFARMKR